MTTKTNISSFPRISINAPTSFLFLEQRLRDKLSFDWLSDLGRRSPKLSSEETGGGQKLRKNHNTNKNIEGGGWSLKCENICVFCECKVAVISSFWIHFGLYLNNKFKRVALRWLSKKQMWGEELSSYSRYSIRVFSNLWIYTDECISFTKTWTHKWLALLPDPSIFTSFSAFCKRAQLTLKHINCVFFQQFSFHECKKVIISSPCA